jgi:hypothetical protein
MGFDWVSIVYFSSFAFTVNVCCCLSVFGRHLIVFGVANGAGVVGRIALFHRYH